MGTEEIKKDVNASNWQTDLAYDQWKALPVSGPRPPARYKVHLYYNFKETLRLNQREISSEVHFLSPL